MQIDINISDDSGEVDVSSAGVDGKMLSIGDVHITMDYEQTESIHAAINPFFYNADDDEQDRKRITSNNIELCSALKAVLALTGESDEVSKIINDVLSECEE